MNNKTIEIINKVYNYCTENNIVISAIKQNDNYNYRRNYDLEIPWFKFLVDNFSDDLVKFVNKIYKEYNVLVTFALDETAFNKFEDNIKKLYNKQVKLDSLTNYQTLVRGYWEVKKDEFDGSYYFAFEPYELMTYKYEIINEDEYNNMIDDLYSKNVIVNIM